MEFNEQSNLLRNGGDRPTTSYGGRAQTVRDTEEYSYDNSSFAVDYEGLSSSDLVGRTNFSERSILSCIETLLLRRLTHFFFKNISLN